MDPRAARRLGETAAGHAAVSHADLDRALADGQVVGVYHADCLPAFLPVDALRKSSTDAGTEVTLERVPFQRFHCVDTQGLPVKGAAVILSRSGDFASAGDEPAAPGLPGPAPHPIYVALTGADGAAQRAVAPGPYRVQVVCGIEYATVQSSVDLPVDLPQTEAIVFTLGRVFFVGVAVVGDEVVTTNVRLTHVTQANAQQGRLVEIQERLRSLWESQNPGHSCEVLVGFRKGRGVPTAAFSLCLARSGWHDLSLEYQPLEPGSQPTLVDASGFPAVGMATVELGWEHGPELPLVRLRRAGDWRLDTRLLSRLVSQATELVVPPGEYLLEAVHAPDWPFLPRRRVELAAGGRLRVLVAPREDAAVVRLAVLTRDGRPAQDVSVSLEQAGTVLQQRRLEDGTPALLCAAPGRVVLRIHAAGCLEQQRELELLALAQAGIHRVDLTLDWAP
jgi:hypothetical protein